MPWWGVLITVAVSVMLLAFLVWMGFFLTMIRKMDRQFRGVSMGHHPAGEKLPPRN